MEYILRATNFDGTKSKLLVNLPGYGFSGNYNNSCDSLLKYGYTPHTIQWKDLQIALAPTFGKVTLYLGGSKHANTVLFSQLVLLTVFHVIVIMSYTQHTHTH